MKKKTFGVLILLLSVMLIQACDKSEQEEIMSSAECKSVTIQAMTPEENQDEIKVFIFNFKSGNLVTRFKVNSSKIQKEVKLRHGDYVIVCLSGVSDEIIGKNPKYTSVLTGFKQPVSKVVSYASRKFTVKNNKSLKLSLNMINTMASTEFSLNGLEDAKKVELEIANLYTSFLMNGKTTKELGTAKIKCHKEGGVWKSDKCYIFGSGSELPNCIINIEKENIEESYTYTFKNKIMHNHPYIITASYLENCVITGEIVSSGWAETEYINFEFGDSNKTRN